MHQASGNQAQKALWFPTEPSLDGGCLWWQLLDTRLRSSCPSTFCSVLTILTALATQAQPKYCLTPRQTTWSWSSPSGAAYFFLYRITPGLQCDPPDTCTCTVKQPTNCLKPHRLLQRACVKASREEEKERSIKTF